MTIQMENVPPPKIDAGEVLKKATDVLHANLGRQIVSQWEAQQTFKEFEFEGLGEMYAAPDESVRFRIGGEYTTDVRGLWPANGTLLFAAQAKAGKTTAVLNIEYSLVTGTMFLNRFHVKPLGDDDVLVVLNNEVSATQYSRWMKKRGIPVDPRVKIANLRGKAASVNILDPGIRQMFLDRLAPLQPSILIVDPIGPIMRAMGVDENDNTTVGLLLDAFNGLRPDIPSLKDIMIVHHSGHETDSGGMRAGGARGASAWNDIPDAIWNYKRVKDEPGIRKLIVRGRDVYDDGEIDVKFDEEILALSSTDGFSITDDGNAKMAPRKPSKGRGSGK